MSKLTLTVVVPVYNEEQVIRYFYARTRGVLDSLQDIEAWILFVVDKCMDNTLEVLRNIAVSDARCKVIALSSRFGHQMSLLAGIENAQYSEAIIMMDGDLQHPPELIPDLLARFREGFDVVNTIRKDTIDVSLARKMTGNIFYKMLSLLSDVQINANAADFRLISSRVARVLATDFQERNMFLRGLFSWIGFKQANVSYIAEKRFAGESKYSFSMMLRLAVHSILSFSTKPLQIGIFVGVGFAAIAFLLLVLSVIDYFLEKAMPSGFTTIVAFSLLFSGVQLIVMGVMGVYIGGIYNEVKGRPRYIIDEMIGFALPGKTLAKD
jgi:dolichol-phosphate mannosyltransferase